MVSCGQEPSHVTWLYRLFRRIGLRLKDPFGHKAMSELLRHHHRLVAEYEHLKSERTLDFTFAALRTLLEQRKCRFKTVIDVGASDGRWTKEFAQSFPEAQYLLFECDSRHAAAITDYASRHANVDVVLAAASDSSSPLFFTGDTPDAGAVRQHALDTSMSVSATTISAEVRKRALPGPYFLKLDVHGYEQPVLRGAEEIFDQIELIQIEVYNFNLGDPNCLRFPQMCELLEQRGFRPIYLCDPLARPKDGALFQFDLLFAKVESSPEFPFEGWN